MSLKYLSNRLDSFIVQYASLSIYTVFLGWARTLLATGTFLTLLFTDEHVQFKSGLSIAWSTGIVPLNAINIFTIVSDQYISLVKWLACLLLLVVASGWRPRFTCIIHWYISACFLNAALDIEGGDQITSNLTLLLIPVSLLDNRKWHWQNRLANTGSLAGMSKGIVANTIFFIIKLQVCVIYLHSAIGKFAVDQWINGTAPYYWFNHSMYGMSNWLKPLVNPLVTNAYTAFILSWGVMLFELVLATAIFIQRKRYKKLFIAAVIFHFLIVLVHGLFSFFFAMSGALCLYFMVEYYSMRLNEKHS